MKGLLETGTIKEKDKPLWFDIYTHFPPEEEPRFERPIKDIKVPEIFYPEDCARAKIHKVLSKELGVIDLTDQEKETHSQKWIKSFNNYISEGLSEEEALKKLKDLFRQVDSSLVVNDLFKQAHTSKD